MNDKIDIIKSGISWMYEYLHFYQNSFNNKDNIQLETLNEMSNELLEIYYQKRLKFRNLIMSDKELYQMMYTECKKNILTWILFEGVSKDVNRNPKAKIQPILPYRHQIPLLQTFNDTKNVLVIKSRRQGASLMFAQMMEHNLVFGDDITDFTTHKDLNSLDKKGDITNTLFGKIRFGLQHSMFINQIIFKNKSDNLRVEDCRIVNGTNSLIGQVLSPNTSVGFQCSNGFIDEIAIVEDSYPNSSDYILGAIATSTNRLFLYSTFRGTKGQFYKTFENHDDKYWNFITLDWKDHPLCNTEWYEKACALMNQDKVMIAQELNHDATATVKGQVFYYISKENKIQPSQAIDIIKKGRKYIFFDAGGGTSATALIMVYYDGDKIYLHNVIKTTTMDEHMILRELNKNDFHSAELYGDISGNAQTGAYKKDWFSLLRGVGIRCNPVQNTGMDYYRSKVNFLLLEKKLFYNANVNEFNDLVNARYKQFENAIEKDGASHIADALCYGIKVLFPRSTMSTF